MEVGQRSTVTFPVEYLQDPFRPGIRRTLIKSSINVNVPRNLTVTESHMYAKNQNSIELKLIQKFLGSL